VGFAELDEVVGAVIPGNTPRVLAAISDRTVVEFAMLCDENFAGSTDRVRRNPTSVMVQ
jgi:hypothetical protein